MKVMGLSQLCLVAPKKLPNAESHAMAAGADDLLIDCQIVESLAEALVDCSFVFGTTARERSLQWPIVSPRAAALKAAREVNKGTIGIVFGPEHSGLSNQELAFCHQLIRIPTDSEFSSLNLAQAVQVCAYELRMAFVDTAPSSEIEDKIEPNELPANLDATTKLYEHWIKVMTDTKYLFPDNPRILPQRVLRMLTKSRFTVTETQIFRGFLKSVEQRLANDNADNDNEE